MGEALRHVQGAVFVGAERDCLVLQVGAALRPEVHDDVHERALVALTSFASECGGNWKCMPRSVPFLVL